MTSSNEKPDQQEGGRQEINLRLSQTENEKTSQEDSQSEDATKQMILGLQSERHSKKGFIDGLLSRSGHSQQEGMPTESTEHYVVVDIANDENTTDENWRQEKIQDLQREDNRDNSKDVDSVDREIEIDQEDKPTSVSAKCGQRRNGIVSIATDGQLGQPNSGFEYERSEEIEEECPSDTSGLQREKNSMAFNFSELSVVPLLKEDERNDFMLNATDEKLPTVEERSQEEEKETESVKNGCKTSASGDKQEVLGLPVSSPIHPAKKRRPNKIKHWLRDPNLYKVCVYKYIFACFKQKW